MAAEYVTAGSEYNGKEAVDIIIDPIKERMMPMGIRVISTMGGGTYKDTQLGPLSKILMPYLDGWQGGSGSELKQRKYSLSEFKAEASYSKQDYLAVVQIEAIRLAKNTGNDIDGTMMKQAEDSVFGVGVQNDTVRIWWLGDSSKKHNSAGTYHDQTTTFAIGDEDKFYSNIDGVWKNIFSESADYTVATDAQVRRVNLLDSTVLSTPAVAEVETLTITGSSGTANVVVEGKAYLATFNTNLSTTASDFVTTHAAAILANHDIVVTSSSADLISTSNTAGVAITTSITAASGNLNGSTASTTANVVPTLAAGEAITLFEKMYDNSSEELQDLHENGGYEASESTPLRYYVTRAIAANYRNSLTATNTTEAAYTAVVDGVKRYHWNGIPIIPMPIETFIRNDFRNKYPNRAILTTANNIAVVMADGNGFASASQWFEKKDNLNMTRAQFEFGAGFTFPKLMTVGY